MMRTISATMTVLLITAAGCFAASAHLRQADGSWVELDAIEADGSVGFTITPEQADGGRALVVINKPQWMVLEDETPPTITGCEVAGEARDLAPGDGPLTIEGLGDDPEGRRLVVRISDDANPLDAAGAILQMEGRPAVRPEVIAEDRDAHTLTLALDLSDFGPGAWRGTLQIADLSPMANRVTLPLSFSIAGMQIAEDQRSISISGGGAGFTVKSDGRATVAVDAAGVGAFITLQPEGQKHLYLREFAAMEELPRENGWSIVQAKVALEDIDGKPVTDEEVGASLEMRFAVHGDIPAVVVRTRATNVSDATRTMYPFWGWLPGDGFVTADGVAHDWSEQYADVTPDGWLLLPSRTQGQPGVGWISEDDFAESRLQNMLLYSVPQKPALAPGESVEMTFALTPAQTIEEVEAVARRLVEAGALELQVD